LVNQKRKYEYEHALPLSEKGGELNSKVTNRLFNLMTKSVVNPFFKGVYEFSKNISHFLCSFVINRMWKTPTEASNKFQLVLHLKPCRRIFKGEEKSLGKKVVLTGGKSNRITLSN
jgi:hypothetical protein